MPHHDDPLKSPVTTGARANKLRKNMTKGELKLWRVLKNRQIANAKFRRQHPIEPYIADFACISLKLIIEVDGDGHWEAAQQAHDERRDSYLVSQGWRVVRIPSLAVHENLEGVCEQIGRVVLEQGNLLSHKWERCRSPILKIRLTAA